MILQAFDSPEIPRVRYTPEDLVRVTKPITLATAKAVAAGNSCFQDDVIVAANVGRKAISDMLTTCKVVLQKPLQLLKKKRNFLFLYPF